MCADLPFRIETLLEQCGGSKEIGGVILDEFLVQIETDTKEMASCLARGDLAQAGKVGHRLKGTAGVLGASKLHTLCFALETAGKEGNAEVANHTFHEIQGEAERCVTAVPKARTLL